jgi:hypothetical protein
VRDLGMERVESLQSVLRRGRFQGKKTIIRLLKAILGAIQKIRVIIGGRGGGSSNLTQNVTVGEGGV